ncbi:MAG: uncharacterized protein H6R40_1639, partial [Gemmatimonadetes bacterium]|nr:uncharacterized protein [Gemmatimonadota bacterium]
DDNRYFDVFVEYAKAGPEDILIQITACNRGPDPAPLHLLPTLWFRNTWSWGGDAPRPLLRTVAPGVIQASHPELGERFLAVEGEAELLFTENETNTERLVQVPNRTPWVKDAFHGYLVQGRQDAVNPERTGSKAAAHYVLMVDPGASRTVRLRLSDVAPAGSTASQQGQTAPFSNFENALSARRAEAAEFYRTVIPPSLDADAANVVRQALAGMLWSKQFYHYDVDRWLKERGGGPSGSKRAAPRNGPGTICTRPTSSRCRTSGSTHGTPRGTWLSTACR